MIERILYEWNYEHTTNDLYMTRRPKFDLYTSKHSE